MARLEARAAEAEALQAQAAAAAEAAALAALAAEAKDADLSVLRAQATHLPPSSFLPWYKSDTLRPLSPYRPDARCPPAPSHTFSYAFPARTRAATPMT
mgnify:FL=1